jgi:hypothetical protein
MLTPLSQFGLVCADILGSVRINERPARRAAVPGSAEASPASLARSDEAAKSNKKMAYLLDLEHIRVVDLVTGINIATINHDSKVASHWLPLSALCWSATGVEAWGQCCAIMHTFTGLRRCYVCHRPTLATSFYSRTVRSTGWI